MLKTFVCLSSSGGVLLHLCLHKRQLYLIALCDVQSCNRKTDTCMVCMAFTNSKHDPAAHDRPTWHTGTRQQLDTQHPEQADIPETNLEGEKTWVGCRKAPPSPLTIRCSGSWGCHPDTVLCPLVDAPSPDRRLLCSSARSSVEVTDVVELAYVEGSAIKGGCCPVETLRCTAGPSLLLLLVPFIMPSPTGFETVRLAAGTACMLCVVCPRLMP